MFLGTWWTSILEVVTRCSAAMMPNCVIGGKVSLEKVKEFRENARLRAY